MLLSWLFIYFNLFLAAAVISLSFRNLAAVRWPSRFEPVLVIYLSAALTSLTLIYHPYLNLYLALSGLTSWFLLFLRRRFPDYTWAGLNFYLATHLLTLVGVAWSARFFFSLEISPATKFLLLAATPLLVFFLPANAVGLIEQYDALCRDRWKRPRRPYPVRSRTHNPFVTIQVPTHREPPEVVIATLNRLSELDYDRFEVLVVDNNTADPALWQPVEAHCRQLGSRFRFLHVEGLAGAKAGALNWSHRYLNPQTTILGIIDADYQVQPNFLAALVGYFDDPKIGFVQTPHDYRDWEYNPFLSMCYWEYKSFFNTTMVSINEKDAGITVGTMCLIRRQALELAGGWSEWCVTEDSELAIRIHRHGFSSIYVNRTLGRGLIPDTFESYKKQRYRWTAGPVQEFLHHYRNLLDFRTGSSACTLTQRLYHLHHGIHNTLTGLALPLLVITLAIISSLVWHREIVPVPLELWLAATVTLVSGLIMDLLIHRTVIKPSLRQYLGKTLALAALTHTVTLAAFRTLVTGDAAWHRTNKFKSSHSYLTALYSVREELAIGLGLILFIIVCICLLPYHGLALMLLIGIGYTALNYLAAPLVAIIAVWSARRPAPTRPSSSPSGFNLAY